MSVATVPTTRTRKAAAPAIPARIEPVTGGVYDLVVPIDGEVVRVPLRPGWRVRNISLLNEVARLLAWHAGYEPADAWESTDSGAYITTVVPMSGRCRTCVHGCRCQLGDAGCGHHGCFVADDTVRNTCPGAALHVANRRRRHPVNARCAR